jgi:hypothetical protein
MWKVMSCGTGKVEGAKTKFVGTLTVVGGKGRFTGAMAARFLSSGVHHFYRLDYFVFALYLIDAWLPSQNGLFWDAPHRQTVIRLRTSYW